MTTTDLVTIIGNLSQSLYPMQRFISGFAYLLGILFFITAISKFKKIGDKKGHSPSQEKMYSPVMYMVMGAFLLYLPSILHTLANTAFGVGNVISYTSYNSMDIYSSMGLLVRTAGILWFVRGCVLIAHASEPGTKDGSKGLLFLFSGVLAMNFANTIAMVDYILMSFIKLSLTIKTNTGF